MLEGAQIVKSREDQGIGVEAGKMDHTEMKQIQIEQLQAEIRELERRSECHGIIGPKVVTLGKRQMSMQDKQNGCKGAGKKG